MFYRTYYQVGGQVHIERTFEDWEPGRVISCAACGRVMSVCVCVRMCRPANTVICPFVDSCSHDAFLAL